MTVEPLATRFADPTIRSRKLHLAYWCTHTKYANFNSLLHLNVAAPFLLYSPELKMMWSLCDLMRVLKLLFVLSFFSVWMPSLSVMELSRQLCGKMRRSSKKTQYSSSPTTTLGLEIHFYTPGFHQLEYTTGCFTAEQLCVDAAKKCCKWISCLLFPERKKNIPFTNFLWRALWL